VSFDKGQSEVLLAAVGFLVLVHVVYRQDKSLISVVVSNL